VLWRTLAKNERQWAKPAGEPPLTAVRPTVLLLALVLAARAGAQPAPDFDGADWKVMCAATEPAVTVSPLAANLVGDPTFPSTYVAFDQAFLYFRYRVDGDPSDSRTGFKDTSWTALVQTPRGSGFQFQYQLTLNGGARGTDTLEIWLNTVANDLTLRPLSNDDSEGQLASVPYNQGPTLARSRATNDGSSFRNTPDYFVEFAFPIELLRAQSMVANAAEVADLLFIPATSARPNGHNKDTVACPFFLPTTTLSLTKAFNPASVPANLTSPVALSLVVRNTGATMAGGLILRDAALPPLFTGVSVSTSDAAAMVVSTNPLDVRLDHLPPGGTFTVRLDAQVTPACGAEDVSGTANVSSTSAEARSANASLDLPGGGGPEVCDGADNDCDDQIDEADMVPCDDGNLCNGIETCGGTAGCQPGFPPTCGDGDPCTADRCEANACQHDRDPNCRGCTANEQCADGDGCTTDTCNGDVCANTPITGCQSCTTASQCADTNPCTDDVCDVEGVCRNVPRTGCIPCTTPARCDDDDPCTTDACSAGACISTAIPGCRSCQDAAACEDGNACTEDACIGNLCTRTEIPDCGTCTPVAEACANGADDDCDRQTDCADPDCAAAPECGRLGEVCGNCLDDDGDGLVDWEDIECCTRARVLGLERVLLRAPGAARVRGDRLRLETLYASSTPALFDPLRRDTSVVVSDASGPLVCATIGAEHWRRGRSFSFRFNDKAGGFAGGLQLGRFVINRRGELMFSARSRSIALRQVAGGAVRITVRSGTECAQSTASLRSKKSGLVFP
jgi:hypothetical protein